MKTFDTVDHDTLCTKLHFYGVCGVAQKWIQSYLENRKQFSVLITVIQKY